MPLTGITVTSHAYIFEISFGDYAALPKVGVTKRTFRKEFSGFGLSANGTCVIAYVGGVPDWQLHFEEQAAPSEALKVESVNGVVPTSLANLYQLLIDCLKTV